MSSRRTFTVSRKPGSQGHFSQSSSKSIKSAGRLSGARMPPLSGSQTNPIQKQLENTIKEKESFLSSIKLEIGRMKNQVETQEHKCMLIQDQTQTEPGESEILKEQIRAEQETRGILERMLRETDVDIEHKLGRLKNMKVRQAWIVLKSPKQSSLVFHRKTDQALAQLTTDIKQMQRKIKLTLQDLSKQKREMPKDGPKQDPRLVKLRNECHHLELKYQDLLQRDQKVIGHANLEADEIKSGAQLILRHASTRLLIAFLEPSFDRSKVVGWQALKRAAGLGLPRKAAKKVMSLAIRKRRWIFGQMVFQWYRKAFEDPLVGVRLNQKVQRIDFARLKRTATKRNKKLLSLRKHLLKPDTRIASLLFHQNRRTNHILLSTAFRRWKQSKRDPKPCLLQLARLANKKVSQARFADLHKAFFDWLGLNSHAHFNTQHQLHTRILKQRLNRLKIDSNLSSMKHKQFLKARAVKVRAFKYIKQLHAGIQLLKHSEFLLSLNDREDRAFLQQMFFLQVKMGVAAAKLRGESEKLGLIEPVVKKLQKQCFRYNLNLGFRRSQYAVRMLSAYLARKLLRAALQAWRRKLPLWRSFRIFCLKRAHFRLSKAFAQYYRLCHADKIREQWHQQETMAADSYNRQNLIFTEKHVKDPSYAKRQRLRKLKRLVVRKHETRFKRAVTKWRLQAELFTSKLRGGQFLLDVAKHRIRLQAFKLLVKKVGEKKKLRSHVGKLKVKSELIRFRHCFEAIACFAAKSKQHRRVIKLMVIKTENHLLRSGISKWLRFTFKSQVDACRQLHDQEKAEGALCEQDLINRQTALRYLNESGSLSQQTMRVLVAQTLQKWLLRGHKEALKFGFTRFKAQAQARTDQAKFAATVINCQVKLVLKLAWQRWTARNNALRIDEVGAQIKLSTQQAQDIQKQMVHDQEALVKEKIESETRITHLLTSWSNQDPGKRMLDNSRQQLIDHMAAKRSRMDYKPRMKLLLDGLNSVLKSEKKAIMMITKCVEKMVLQDSFTEINKYANHPSVRYRHRSYLLILKFWRRKLAVGFNHWRYCLYHQELGDYLENKVALRNEVESHSDFVKQQLTYHSILTNERNTGTMLYNCFQVIKKENLWKRNVRKNTILYRATIVNQQARRALLRWQDKIAQKKRIRTCVKRVKNAIYNIYKKPVFLAIKAEMTNVKALVKKLQNFVDIQQYTDKNLAFQQIRFFSANSTENCFDVKYQQQYVWSCYQKVVFERRLREGLYKFGLRNDRSRVLLGVLKQFFIHNLTTHYYRAAFTKWHNFTEKQKTVEFNENGEGPVCVQNWNLRHQLDCLVAMVSAEGTPDDIIVRICKFTQANYEDAAFKVISRVAGAGDSNQRLLAVYFDQIKKKNRLIRGMNKFSRVYLNYRDQPDLQKAFCRWKSNRWRRELSAIPFPDLQLRSNKNTIQLMQCSTMIDRNIETMNDAEFQIEYFISKMPSCKSLGLTLIRSNAQKVKCQSVSKMSDNSHGVLKVELQNAICRNLDKMEHLKNRIAHLERTNQQVMDGTDNVRGLALQAMNDKQMRLIYTKENQDLREQVKEQDRLLQQLQQVQLRLRQRLQTQAEHHQHRRSFESSAMISSRKSLRRSVGGSDKSLERTAKKGSQDLSASEKSKEEPTLVNCEHRSRQSSINNGLSSNEVSSKRRSVKSPVRMFIVNPK